MAIVDEYLGTEFEGGRHTRRVEKISQIENWELKIERVWQNVDA
jgi:ribose 5-phosphate isomerase RpiB